MLAVSFAFPPLAYPRSIQVARLLKHLNLKTVLVCAHELEARKDLTLEPDAEGTLEKCLRIPFCVSATTRFANQIAYRFSRRLWSRWNQMPDNYRGWHPAALKAVKAYAQANSYTPQVLASFSHPLSDHLIGLALKEYFRVPWIAHFSDPWVDNPFRESEPDINEKNLELEWQVMRQADRVIFTSQETADLVMSKYPPAWRNKSRVLPQCFDRSAFLTPLRSSGTTVTIRYVGNFYGTRTPEPLFRTIEALLTTDPSSLRGVTFELIGITDMAAIDNAGLRRLPEGLIAISPPVGYQESLSQMIAAHGLLIIDAPAETSVFLPSKLIDYIGAGRPVLGFTPKGAASNLIRQLGGWVTDPVVTDASVETMKNFLSFLRSQNNDQLLWGEPTVREKYEASHIARCFEVIAQELLK